MWPGPVLASIALLLLARRGGVAARTAPPAGDRASRIARAAIAAIFCTWVLAIFATYAPLATAAVSPLYRLPEIFDLPKQLFATESLRGAPGWPPPNPFFFDEPFACNFVFYAPVAWVAWVAWVARIAGEAPTPFVLFPAALIAVSLALPVTVLELVRTVTPSRLAHVGAVALATWLGGLIPLWFDHAHAIGATLYVHKLVVSWIWIDELFVSAIYVPQHLFASLCAIVSVRLVLASTPPWVAWPAAAVIAAAGMLASLILAPHIALAVAIAAVVAAAARRRAGPRPITRTTPAIMAVAGCVSLALCIPLLAQAASWSGAAGAWLAWPVAGAQWLYVLAAAPLALVGIGGARRDALLAAFALMCAIGCAGLAFGAYPDLCLKSGLWLRIALVPLAPAGLGKVAGMASASARTVAMGIVAWAAAFIIALNAPTIAWLVRSAWRPVDPGTAKLVEKVRQLPASARIALVSSDQVLAALAGRPLDMDL